ncbi:MFS transporter [Patescibacteria group bacterium]
MSNVHKFFLSRFISHLYIWGVISIPYFIYRGLGAEEAFGLLGLYSLLVVLLEYPTGVVGDVFGHKTSLILGYVFSFIGFVILAFNMPARAYVIPMLILSVAASFTSGSDVALLKSISKSFKKDMRMYHFLLSAAFVPGSLLGGVLAEYSLPFSVAVMSGLYFVSLIILFFVKAPKKVRGNLSGNVFSTVWDSVGILKNPRVVLIFLLFAFVRGFSMNIKSLVNTMNSIFEFPFYWVGIVVALGFLFRSVGYLFSDKLEKYRSIHLIALMSLLLVGVGMIQKVWFAAVVFVFSNLIVAAVALRLKFEIFEMATEISRASVLSLLNLFSRLFSSFYLFASGLLIVSSGYYSLILLTGVFFSILYLMRVFFGSVIRGFAR